MKTTIYYFSGTGNSLKIARDLAEMLDDSELIPIAKIWQNDHIAATTEKVGFVFPLYYWGLPKILYDFLTKIELNKANYIFAVITRGASIDGIPLYQLGRILEEKSKILNAGFFILMPDNYIILADGPSEDIQNELFKAAKKEIESVYEIISENKDNFKIDKYTDKSKIKTKRRERAEKVSKKFHNDVLESDKFFVVDDNCNSCGTCENVCPVDNILLIEGRPQWQHKCQQCLACINFCPENSIQYGEKTVNRKRYHHPEITVDDLTKQKY